MTELRLPNGDLNLHLTSPIEDINAGVVYS